MNAKKLAELLQKYQDGQCTEEERIIIEKFYQDFDAEEDQLPAQSEMQPAYDALYQQVLGQVKEIPVIGTQPFRYRRWAAAAAILLLCGAAAWFFLQPRQMAPASEKAVARQTEKAKKRFIKLPDGSTVLLNDRSELKYPASFSGAAREVYLSGEAYFDIVASNHQPFVVHTGKVATTVLGTVFNIKALPGEEDVTVTVEKGKVKVEADGKPLGIVASNQQLSVSKVDVRYLKNDSVNVDPVVHWVKQDLVFDNTTYEEAAQVLMQQYGIRIEFRNTHLQNCRFTTSFKNQSSLEDILTVLCAFNQSSYSIKDSTVTISGGNCQ
ncbi:FecR family protein [Chitinophaga arvensicola]|uniref:Ferric-dicitrate binding protein FerR, regulates iron transport through sigma-19 n=1 Tax=Chitinophaga arvensicola TaxID=29529 RepID=A0A1I0S6Q7_9BACT|nr:FecR family protein [Chitinophaga arvensicola]SEW50991.1 ferric-dicitrate binding protein FerR, regulates iron transport through sigma-19 [Chitinophaga arvensicola]